MPIGFPAYHPAQSLTNANNPPTLQKSMYFLHHSAPARCDLWDSRQIRVSLHSSADAIVLFYMTLWLSLNVSFNEHPALWIRIASLSERPGILISTDAFLKINNKRKEGETSREDNDLFVFSSWHSFIWCLYCWCDECFFVFI